MDEKTKYRITEFLKTERKKLKNYVRYMIDDTAERDSEDIIQDVMLNIFNLPDISIPIENLTSYIYRSIRNKIFDIMRKKKMEHVSIDNKYNNTDFSLKDILYDKRHNIESEIEKEETRNMLFSAIDSLDKDYKEIIFLTEFEGKSFREISDERNIPIGTLLSRKSRAVQKIRDRLKLSLLL